MAGSRESPRGGESQKEGARRSEVTLLRRRSAFDSSLSACPRGLKKKQQKQKNSKVRPVSGESEVGGWADILLGDVLLMLEGNPSVTQLLRALHSVFLSPFPGPLGLSQFCG